MREIKFRGYIPQNIAVDGRWVYGYLANCNKDVCFIENENRYMVLKNTVGQFTGLHDKNGKKIYDGDIVKECGMKDTWTLSRRDEFSERVHIVGWHEHDMQWVGALLDEYKLGLIDTRDLGFLNDKYMLEIIGNIHENKELLEDVK